MEKVKKRLVKAFDSLYSFCKVIELAAAAVITVAILIFLVFLIMKFVQTPIHDPSEQFIEFLRGMLSLVIGIEFVKILIRHQVEDVLDVLIFAIARFMIVSHGSGTEVLLQIIGVAILFAVRKYLAFKGEHEPEEL
ncbi:MAG: phosphate-starvation-inducible PsiE family protein [Eubacterium sp.]|nr:phosphate-starvation-inducible PsiE family protein [Eubacterium sp.]